MLHSSRSFSLANEDIDEMTQISSFVDAPIDATTHFGPPFTQRTPTLAPTTNFFGYNQSAYMQDPNQRIQGLEERCRNLEFQVVALTAERDTLKTVCQDHLGRSQSRPNQDLPQFQQGPAAMPRVSPADSGPRPTQQTHPKIQFWNKTDWTTWIGRPQNYTAGKTSFLEGENGEQLDLKTVSLIRDSMRLAWNDLAAQKRAPFTWGRATASVHDFFHSYMEEKWPILKLCNNGWKLDELASVTYPGYKRSYLDGKGHLKVKVKTEENTPGDDDGNLDHAGDEDSNGNENFIDEKNKPETSKSEANHISQKRKSLKQPKPGARSKRTKVSFAADETVVPEVLDREIEGSKSSTEDPDTLRIVDTNDAPTLSNEDVDNSTLGWSPNPNPVDPATSSVEDDNSNIIPMNVCADDLATTTIDGDDDLDALTPISDIIPSPEPSAGTSVVSTVPNEKLTSTAVTNEMKKGAGTTKTDQVLTDDTIEEPLSSSVNKAKGSDEKLEGNQNPLQQERSKPARKKSVRLLMKSPISMESLSAAKIDMPKLPEAAPTTSEPPAPTTSKPKPAQSDKDQEGKKQKTKGRMRVPSERSGRNLCARRWLKQVNKDGTKDEFEEYWWTLTKEQRASYDTEADSIPSGKEWSKQAHANGKLH